MKKKCLAIAAFCLAVACSASTSAAKAPEAAPQAPTAGVVLNGEERYSLRPGDKLEISVYGQGGLSDTLTVNLDGCISPVLLGELYVKGKSVAELQKELVTLYSRYLKEPLLRVNILEYGPTRVYVLGEIKNPGLFELRKSSRVMDALGAAHGFKLKSSKKKVYLIRKGADKPVFIDINRYLRKGDQSQNCELFDGDTLYLASNHKK